MPTKKTNKKEKTIKKTKKMLPALFEPFAGVRDFDLVTGGRGLVDHSQSGEGLELEFET